MKANTFKDYFLDAIKGLKRNLTITIYSIISISVTFFIIGIFFLYIRLINNNNTNIIFVNFFVSNKVQ